MQKREETLLLLRCALGESIQPLSETEYGQLALRMELLRQETPDAELDAACLRRLGCSATMQERIPALLRRREQLARYLAEHPELSIRTRISAGFPQRLRRLGERCPAALFLKGDVTLLQTPCISLVGSRCIAPANRAFAAAIGVQAAREGYTLVSGGASGADRAAQDACLRAGGRVICVVPDALIDHPAHARVLFCSLEGYDLAFTAARALQRNGVIHALGEKTFVAQSDFARGGTWSGTTENLRCGLSEVYVYDDGSAAAAHYAHSGAVLLAAAPQNIAVLGPDELSIFDYNLQSKRKM